MWRVNSQAQWAASLEEVIADCTKGDLTQLTQHRHRPLRLRDSGGRQNPFHREHGTIRSASITRGEPGIDVRATVSASGYGADDARRRAADLPFGGVIDSALISGSGDAVMEQYILLRRNRLAPTGADIEIAFNLVDDVHVAGDDGRDARDELGSELLECAERLIVREA